MRKTYCDYCKREITDNEKDILNFQISQWSETAHQNITRLLGDYHKKCVIQILKTGNQMYD